MSSRRALASTLRAIRQQSVQDAPLSFTTSLPARVTNNTVQGLTQTRSYASFSTDLSVNSSKPERVYPDRKAFLFASYQHLLETSDMVLLFQHNGLSTSEMGKIRRAIASVPLPDSLATTNENEIQDRRARLTLARTGIMSAVSQKRTIDAFDSSVTISPLLNGPIALLTCPSLSPKYLKGVLASINKALSFRPQPTASIGATTPLNVSPRLMLIGGLMEKNKVVSAQDVIGISETPEKDGLYGQLVGLLEMPGSQLVGLLNQAGGGSLLRTIQGLEAGLKEKEGGGAGPTDL